MRTLPDFMADVLRAWFFLGVLRPYAFSISRRASTRSIKRLMPNSPEITRDSIN